MGCVAIAEEWPREAIRAVRAANAERDEALEELRQLRQMVEDLYTRHETRPWGLTAAEASVARIIAHHGPVLSERVDRLLAYERGRVTVSKEPWKLIHVYVCKIRKKLPSGIKLITGERAGWGGSSTYYFSDPAGVLEAFKEQAA